MATILAKVLHYLKQMLLATTDLSGDLAVDQQEFPEDWARLYLHNELMRNEQASPSIPSLSRFYALQSEAHALILKLSPHGPYLPPQNQYQGLQDTQASMVKALEDLHARMERLRCALSKASTKIAQLQSAVRGKLLCFFKTQGNEQYRIFSNTQIDEILGTLSKKAMKIEENIDAIVKMEDKITEMKNEMENGI